MKKTLALILAIVMMAALAVPAFAVDEPATIEYQEVAGTDDYGCTVSYGVRQSYTVSLPTVINFSYGTDDQVADLSVSNFIINGSNKLVITMDSDFDSATVNDGWEMRATNGSLPVPYTVTKEAPAVANEAHVTFAAGAVANADVDGGDDPTVILEVASNKDGLGGALKLRFATEGTHQAGDYTDQITFGVSIDTITP